MIKAKIVDGIGHGFSAKVSEDNALKVRTLDYYYYENSIRYFVNDTYGQSLNINAQPVTGTSENIYDGQDNVYWTASIIATTPDDFNLTSTDQNHTAGGSQSFEYDICENGDIAQFLRPSGLFTLSNYNILSGWIYITSWPITDVKELLLYGYNTSTGIVGTSVNIGNYVNTTEFNIWQSFNIPLSDMNLIGQSIDAIRTEVVDIGAGAPPHAYLDDLVLTGSLDTGGPYTYEVSANPGENLQISDIEIIMARAYDSTVTDGTLPGLPYDSFLGFTPTNGIVFQIVSENIIVTNTMRSLIEFLSIPGTTITDMGSDGTNTFMKLKYTFLVPEEFSHNSADRVSFRIIDDFSSFLHFTISASCRTYSEPHEEE